MCGIFGCSLTQPSNVGEILVTGIKKLLYRGYDSWGFVVDNDIAHRSLCEVTHQTVHGTLGIAHTRWATHGAPSIKNTHPIQSQDGNWFVVHNGILQNHELLKQKYHCEHASDTDTEIIASLAQKFYDRGKTLTEIAKQITELIDGSYALLVSSKHFPGELAAVCNGSPLVFASTEAGVFFASDPIAFSGISETYACMENNDIVHVSANNYMIEQRQVFRTYALDETEHVYEHHMLKEIIEQPRAIRQLFKGRVYPDRIKLGGLGEYKDILASKHWTLLGCGSSYNVCLCVRPFLEKHFGGDKVIHCEIASDFVMRRAPISPKDTVYIVLSQSGETRDCILACEHIKSFGGKCFGINNRPGSLLDSKTLGGVHLNIGPECAVAATKSFTASIVVFLMIAQMVKPTCNSIIDIPTHIERHIERCMHDSKLQAIAENLSDAWWIIGDGHGYGMACEIALKLQEVAYLHVNSCMGFEMKHGPLALIDNSTHFVYFGSSEIPTIVKSRGGHEWTIHVSKECDEVTKMLCEVISFQCVAYWHAKNKGLSIDRPRNLAKSVTV